MARPLRLAFENATYHITARGNRKENIFYDDEDRIVFINKMDETFKKYSIVCYGYCLMDNHYHLFIKTPYANISKGMHYLNASYTNWFKSKHNINGVIFQGRFKSMLVEEDSYGLWLSAYIHLNPVRAEIVKDPGKYKWSSFQYYTREKKSPLESLDTGFILKQFGENEELSRRKYARYVRRNKKITNPFNDSFRGIAVGSESFIDKIKKRINQTGKKREISETRVIESYKPEEIINIIGDTLGVDSKDVFKKKRGNIFRPLAIYFIKKYTMLDLKQVGDIFGVDYTAISQSCRRLEQKVVSDSTLSGMMRELEMKLETKISQK